MQQREHVQNPVPVIVARNICRPELIGEGLAVSSRQAKSQEGSTEALGSTRVFLVRGVLRRVGLALPGIRLEEVIVHHEVHDAADRVRVSPRCLPPSPRSLVRTYAVPVNVIVEERATIRHSRVPESGIGGVGTSPNLVECWQNVGWISEARVRAEFHDVGARVKVFGPDQVEHPLCFGGVLVFAGIAPTIVRENERRGEVFLTVRRTAVRLLRT